MDSLAPGSPGSPGGLSEGDRSDLETAAQQLRDIEAELLQLSLSAIEPDMHENLMTKLSEVRGSIDDRLGQLSPKASSTAGRKKGSSGPRSFSARPLRMDCDTISERQTRRPATAGPARQNSAGKRNQKRAFPPPTASRRRPGVVRSAIAMDMMKLVDGHRTPSTKLQTDSSADLSTMNFSAVCVNRPGPGPSQYYPDFTQTAGRRRAAASSFGSEDRFKHLAGESKPGPGRLGPGPKYNPSVNPTKKRGSAARMGRESRLGSGVAP